MADVKRKLFELFRSPSRTTTQREKNKHAPSNHDHRHTVAADRVESVTPKVPAGAKHRSPSVNNLGNNSKDSSSESVKSDVLLEWPPTGFASKDVLTPQQARRMIARGATAYSGLRVFIPHASESYFALYAFCENDHEQNHGDLAPFYKTAFSAMSFRVQGPGLAMNPVDTLEQPSLAFCYGNIPGTITLNHWVSLSSRLKRTVELRDIGARPRAIDLPIILERLIYLQGGFEEDYEDLLYKNLYDTFLKDPDRYFNPHRSMEKQIADLIIILSGPQWIDFSNPRNHILGKYFSRNQVDKARSKLFFHQLVLSIELYLRIHSNQHGDGPKKKLLSQLPSCVAWDLALARKWRECIIIVKGPNKIRDFESVKIELTEKKKQVKAMRKFARAIKWPSVAEIDAGLGSRAIKSRPPEDHNAEAMSYFSGVILPGSSLQWLLMISLVNRDKEIQGNLHSLRDMIPHSGFQYRSNTFWSSTCIVGKVLAPTCREIAGWVGPAIPSSDLGRIQMARIRQRDCRPQISVKEIQSMSVRSDPLGPEAELYPIEEYQHVLPDIEDVSNNVRIETFSLKPVPVESGDESKVPRPTLYDACIRFAIEGQSWPMRLAYDVSYICAAPCHKGPHPLFYDYIYRAVHVDEVLKISNWGRSASDDHATDTESVDRSPNEHREGSIPDDNELERVLVIEAFGVPDNEVLARAYCSHWGLNAVIANMQATCMACAIREAYAACLNVVILVEEAQSRLDP